ncbi:MAG: OmpA family protein [Myxococcota bacterium]
MVEEDEPQEEVEEGAPAWMATFSDLATLLLTFFVLLLSFANMDVKNFRTAMGSVKDALGVTFTNPGDFEGRSTTPIEISTVQAIPTLSIHEAHQIAKAAEEVVKRIVKERGLEEEVEVEGTEKGVILRTRDSVLFEPGSDVVQPRGYEALKLVGDLMQSFRGDLEIQGHTDNVPISTARFRSNWELSSARATSVLRHLNEEHALEEKRMHVAGYAATRPIAPLNTSAGRARNRRVEFVFELPVGEAAEASLSEKLQQNLAAPSASASAAPPPGASAPSAPGLAPGSGSAAPSGRPASSASAVPASVGGRPVPSGSSAPDGSVAAP